MGLAKAKLGLVGGKIALVKAKKAAPLVVAGGLGAAGLGAAGLGCGANCSSAPSFSKPGCWSHLGGGSAGGLSRGGDGALESDVELRSARPGELEESPRSSIAVRSGTVSAFGSFAALTFYFTCAALADEPGSLATITALCPLHPEYCTPYPPRLRKMPGMSHPD